MQTLVQSLDSLICSRIVAMSVSTIHSDEDVPVESCDRYIAAGQNQCLDDYRTIGVEVMVIISSF